MCLLQVSGAAQGATARAYRLAAAPVLHLPSARSSALSLTDEALRHFASLLRPMYYPKGAVFSELDTGDRVRFIVEGVGILKLPQSSSLLGERVEVDEWSTGSAPEKCLVVGELRTGSYFGESTLFKDTQHAALVKARTPLLVYEILREELLSFIDGGVLQALRMDSLFAMAYHVKQYQERKQPRSKVPRDAPHFVHRDRIQSDQTDLNAEKPIGSTVADEDSDDGDAGNHDGSVRAEDSLARSVRKIPSEASISSFDGIAAASDTFVDPVRVPAWDLPPASQSRPHSRERLGERPYAIRGPDGQSGVPAPAAEQTLHSPKAGLLASSSRTFGRGVPRVGRSPQRRCSPQRDFPGPRPKTSPERRSTGLPRGEPAQKPDALFPTRLPAVRAPSVTRSSTPSRPTFVDAKASRQSGRKSESPALRSSGDYCLPPQYDMDRYSSNVGAASSSSGPLPASPETATGMHEAPLKKNNFFLDASHPARHSDPSHDRFAAMTTQRELPLRKPKPRPLKLPDIDTPAQALMHSPVAGDLSTSKNMAPCHPVPVASRSRFLYQNKQKPHSYLARAPTLEIPHTEAHVGGATWNPKLPEMMDPHGNIHSPSAGDLASPMFEPRTRRGQWK
ncbi:hypothetical protein CYMTET_13279 [Cymbomonas tetramitiformis]|uniref:Cyclic nucleotide-binding domain-containing protein n=1 Tax=Cymbomonas tetramitiformis TaxID=36881 RepID=A0AAE0GJZ2_9CHLO|nr:hypothetical protein CYMTET_13279 [Cymbomonas tetramitiformis]